MRIETRLKFAISVPLLIALVVSTALVVSYRGMAELQKNGNIVRQIRDSVSGLDNAADSYIALQGERPKRQFLKEHDVIKRLIASVRLQDPDQERPLDVILSDIESAKILFLRLVSSHERTGTIDDEELLKQLQARLVGQLHVRLRDADSNASFLRKLVDDDVRDTQMTTIALIFFVLIIASLPISIVLVRMRKNIASSLANLSKGTTVVAAGNLDYRIEMPATDELGELANSFDAMTENLQNTTITRDVLQSEVTERKKAQEKLALANERLEILHEITNISVSSLSVTEISAQVIKTLEEKFGLANASIFAANEQRDELLPTADLGLPAKYFSIIPPIKIDSEYESASVFRSGKPIIVQDVDDASVAQIVKDGMKKAEALIGKPIKSYIVLPLTAYKKTSGVIVLSWPTTREFSREDIDFFFSIAQEIAVGLENARLFEAEVEAQKQVKSELELSNLLLRAADTLASPIELSELLDTLGEVISKITGRSRLVVRLRDLAGDELKVVSSTGKPEFKVGTSFSLKQQTQGVRDAILQRRRFVVDYESVDQPQEVKAKAKEFKSRLVLFVPIILNNEVIGSIGIDEPGERNEFSRRDIELVEGVTSQAAVGIKNARLFEAEVAAQKQAREELARTTILQEIATTTTTTTTLKKISEDVLSLFEKHLGMIAGDIKKIDEEHQLLETIDSRGFPGELQKLILKVPLEKSSFLSVRSFKTGDVLTHNQDDPASESKKWFDKFGFRNTRYAVIPIKYGGRVFGLINVIFSEKRDFAQAETDLFHSVGQTLGQAFENARLFEAEREALRQEKERAEKLSIIHDITTIATSITDVKEISQKSLDSLGEKLGLAQATIVVLNEERKELVPVALYGYPPELFKSIPPIKIDSAGETSRVFKNGVSTIVENIDTSAMEASSKAALKKFEELTGVPLKSYIGLPLTAYQKTVGVISFGWPKTRTFNKADIDFFTSIAHQIALGITAIETLTAGATEKMVEKKPSYEAEVPVNEQIRILILEDNLADAELIKRELRKSDLDFTAKVVKDKNSFTSALDDFVPNVILTDYSVPGFDGLDALKLARKRFAGIPVIMVSGVIGEEFAVETLKAGATDYVLKDRLVRLVPEIKRAITEARQIAEKKRAQDKLGEQSLVISRLYSQEKYTKALSDALNEIDSIVMSTLDFDKIAEQAVTEASNTIGCDSAGVVLNEKGEWVLKTVYGLPAEALGARFGEQQFSDMKRDLTEAKRPIVIKDALKDKRIPSKIIKEFNVRSVLVAPLITREELTGIIAFNFGSADLISEPVIDFAGKLAASVSLAAENSRLYVQQQNIAHTLQQSLLTVPEKVEGVEFGHVYKSSIADIAEAGGDFYDIFELENGKVGIVIGDVAGKGIEAATLTSLAKNTIRSNAYQNHVAASVIEMTNKIIIKQMEAFEFITLFFGIFNPSSRVLRYCSAGHPPPIIKTSAGVQLLETRSPAIGISADIKFSEDGKVLKPGETLVLYTDGVTEARRQREFFGEERLINFIAGLKPIGPEKIAGAIFNEVMDFSKGHLSDDIAILTISLA